MINNIHKYIFLTIILLFSFNLYGETLVLDKSFMFKGRLKVRTDYKTCEDVGEKN